jgi:colanic acid biosynthesis glycosyl transferase WcaI
MAMRIFVNDFCGHSFPMTLSRDLARKGHVVCHVFFADNKSTPKGLSRQEGDPATLTIEGLHIRRKFSKLSILTRRQADLEYGHVVASRMYEFRPDVVLSANMPLDGQRILQRAAHRIDARFVFWLQDIYSVAVRFVLERKAKFLAGIGSAYFEQLEIKLMRKSDGIVCIAPGFADLLAKWGIPASKFTVIENWAPLDEISPASKNNPWACEHGVADKFCFMYSGTLGMKHCPELLLELAKHLEGSKAARLIVIAAGAGADWLGENARGISPEVLTLLPFQPYEMLSDVMASADVMITLLDSDAGSFAVPSKSLSYLCAGRPQIVAAPASNQAARVVERATAGLVVSSDDRREIVKAAEFLLADPSLCSRYGRNARQYAERAFAMNEISDRFLSLFAELVRTVSDSSLATLALEDVSPHERPAH